MEEQKRANKKEKNGIGRIIVLSVILVVLLVGAAIGARYAYRILKQPETMFEDAAATPIPEGGKEQSEPREAKQAAPAIPSDPSAPPAKKN